jgi:hypothetical protein
VCGGRLAWEAAARWQSKSVEPARATAVCHARLTQVESAAPNVRQQLQEARAALQGNLLVSAEAYSQLKRVSCRVGLCSHLSLAASLGGSSKRKVLRLMHLHTCRC